MSIDRDATKRSPKDLDVPYGEVLSLGLNLASNLIKMTKLIFLNSLRYINQPCKKRGDLTYTYLLLDQKIQRKDKENLVLKQLTSILIYKEFRIIKTMTT